MQHRYADRAFRLSMLRILVVFAAALVIIAACTLSHAEWKPEYADADPAVRDWYENATVTEAAQPRLGFEKCCATSEVVHTKFEVRKKDGDDQWFYVDPKDGKTKQVPPDIIHWGESAPDGQPTLFVLTDDVADVHHLPHGTPTCFYPGQSGQ